jgi:hypothetical protein
MEIYRDSKVIKGWLNASTELNSVHLQARVKKIRDTASRFNRIYFSHVYREFNPEEDSLARAAVNLAEGKL